MFQLILPFQLDIPFADASPLAAGVREPRSSRAVAHQREASVRRGRQKTEAYRGVGE